ncbi:MAG: hypothetical protein GDA49_04360 [Rhodospirillales bacterium]|nr:hypothetical protein [Rhodospirillales bacterium]
MQRTKALVGVTTRLGGGPVDRDAEPITIGTTPKAIFLADAEQILGFIAAVDRVMDACADDEARATLLTIADAERADVEVLEALALGSEGIEEPANRKHLLPKMGGTDIATAAIKGTLPVMTSAVSQIFFHSLKHEHGGWEDLTERELNAALVMMYRSEALLERLLDLGGLPAGSAQGEARIGEGDRGADQMALPLHNAVIASLERGLETVSGEVDPMTHTLFDSKPRSSENSQDSVMSDTKSWGSAARILGASGWRRLVWTMALPIR